jgi:hypothetical protein
VSCRVVPCRAVLCGAGRCAALPQGVPSVVHTPIIHARSPHTAILDAVAGFLIGAGVCLIPVFPSPLCLMPVFPS